ncbi:MAG: hypothetical protein V2A61_08100 [Calditrichota bacterium]
MLLIRDSARTALSAQVREGTDEEIEAEQKHLNAVYEKFTTENGALNSRRNAELMRDDPDGPFLRALEKWDKKKTPKEIQTATTLSMDDLNSLKMDLFTKRTVKGMKTQKVNNESDASVVSLNETGRLDFNRMGELLGKSGD